MSLYSPLLFEKSVTIDLHCLKPKSAKRLVIETIKESHSSKICCIKFITNRGFYEPAILYDDFSSWMEDTKIKLLVDYYKQYNGYYLVFLDLDYYRFKPFWTFVFRVRNIFIVGCILLFLWFLL